MILLVEDDEDVRELLALTLQSRGYAVEVVDNGMAALEVLDRARPCLVILDLVMPVMNGWAVLEQMKARSLSHIPVCVMSALDGHPIEAAATLGKPFDSKALFAIVARYCNHTGESRPPAAEHD